MKLLFLLLLLAPGLSAGDTAKTTVRTVTDLAPGVFTIRHPDAPDEFPQGNTTVIVGERAVLVVDSCYMPSSAREDIAEIRRRTPLPVRYLVNTHWHYDHTLGDGDYAAAFPGLSVVAHTETARNMAGYNPGWFERYPATTAGLQEQLRTGVDPAGKPLTTGGRAEIEESLPGRAPVAAEFAAVKDRLPDITFDRSLELDLGGRVVRLLHLGRGNTAGDIVVHLRQERIVITGDLLTSPVPYLGGGYPSELVATLGAIDALEPALLVPGHGNVLRDRTHLRRVRDFVAAFLPVMSAAIHRSSRRGDFETVQAAVLKAFDVTPWRQAFAGDDPGNLEYFDDFSWPGLQKAAHAEMWRR